MQDIIIDYGLDFTRFREIIKTSNSIVAGSTALHCYLLQNGKNPGFIPGDLDIWMEDTHSIFMENGHFNQQSNTARMSMFLLQHGYNISPSKNNENIQYANLQQIRQIFTFIHPMGKQIQVILLAVSHLLDYISNYFDLSICISWWDPITNTCDTLYPETTLEREVFVIPKEDPWPLKTCSRIEKYMNRGFTLRETFFVCQKDPRTLLNDESCVLKGVKAFDMWTLEDVDAIEFLKASSYHILLKAGNQFHAFHRKNLCTFMHTRNIYLPNIGEVYDTPHNQTIIEDAMKVLPYTDYTIYELVPEFTVPHHSIQKSLYTMKCYTVEGWNTNSISAYFPPFISQLSEDSLYDRIAHAENYFTQREDFYAQEHLIADILDSLI